MVLVRVARHVLLICQVHARGGSKKAWAAELKLVSELRRPSRGASPAAVHSCKSDTRSLPSQAPLIARTPPSAWLPCTARPAHGRS